MKEMMYCELINIGVLGLKRTSDPSHAIIGVSDTS